MDQEDGRSILLSLVGMVVGLIEGETSSNDDGWSSDAAAAAAAAAQFLQQIAPTEVNSKARGGRPQIPYLVVHQSRSSARSTTRRSQNESHCTHDTVTAHLTRSVNLVCFSGWVSRESKLPELFCTHIQPSTGLFALHIPV